MSIEDLIRAIGDGKVLITDHADQEAEADGLSFDEVYFSVVHGEMIRAYPGDKPYPSCLLYGDTFGGILCTACEPTMKRAALRLS